MIQRIQTIYLFLASLALFALYLFPLIHNINLSGAISNISIQGVYQNMPNGNFYSTEFVATKILTAPLAILPLLIIFFYNHRKRQIALGYTTIAIIIGYSFWLAQTVKGVVPGGLEIDFANMGIGMFLSSVSIVFIILAVKAIQRDEKLVRSADRLR